VDIPFRRTKSGITVGVRVQPRSSKKGIDRVEGGVLRVRLTAPPAEGAANAQLIEVLSDALGVGKGSIRIIKGRSSRNKVVEIEGVEEPLRALPGV
jgi:uncharacterized protein (TIGR00251 family)